MSGVVPSFAPVVVAWLVAHVPGISQGDLVLDDAGDDIVTVELDLVFARADAAQLPRPFLVVQAGETPCPTGPVDEADVDADGRALRVVARCAADAGDIRVDVVGLGALAPTHRLALRAADHAGRHDAVLSPATPGLTLPRPHRATPTPPALLTAFAAAAVAFGARRPRALVATLGLCSCGAAVALLVGALPGPAAGVDGAPALVDVVFVVRVVVAVCSVLGVLLDPAPRLRPAALALGAVAAWP